MKNFYRNSVLSALCVVALAAGSVSAQRSRTVSDPASTASTPQAAATPKAVVQTPPSVKAKYEGGVFGYMKKQTGTLNFDDTNSRLVFRDKKGTEYISIPYHSVAAAFADTQSRRPGAATVIGSIPIIYALPALLIKKKYRYLTMQFNDPDTGVQGTTSFKMDNKETVAAVLNALAAKAELVPRGEAFVRGPKPATGSTNTPTPE
ncbi:MAG: hypothetical protein H0T63_09050 [Pyrinomonadaceae bacterium]|nr:hypothetical protein [Pyrinomonadaceae bacterium]MDQ3584427.1 hypothetical protein [Acidobacteriota bacterium]